MFYYFLSLNFFHNVTVICPLPRLSIFGRWSARSGTPPPTAIIIYIHITETDSFRALRTYRQRNLKSEIIRCFSDDIIYRKKYI